MGFKSKVKGSIERGISRYKSSASAEMRRRRNVATERRTYKKETSRLVRDARRKRMRNEAIARANRPTPKVTAVGLQNVARQMGYGLPAQPKPIKKRIKKRIRKSKKRRRRSR